MADTMRKLVVLKTDWMADEFGCCEDRFGVLLDTKAFHAYNGVFSKDTTCQHLIVKQTKNICSRTLFQSVVVGSVLSGSIHLSLHKYVKK